MLPVVSIIFMVITVLLYITIIVTIITIVIIDIFITIVIINSTRLYVVLFFFTKQNSVAIN